jgi:DNA-binding PadR family transcriptional regulator
MIKRAAAPSPAPFLPLKPLELLVLTALAGGERHGYGIRQDIMDQTEGAIQIEAGNLYRHIRRLEDEELVELSKRTTSGDSADERRRYFRITPFGRSVLRFEMLRLQRLVRFAEERSIISPARP